MIRSVLCKALLSTVLAGCGGGTPDYAGTWQYAAGSTATQVCNGTSQTQDLSKNVLVIAQDAGALSVTLEVGCLTDFVATGNQAQVAAGQMCSFANDPTAGMTASQTFSSGTLALTTPTNLTLNAAASETVTSSDGFTLSSCTLTLSGTASKASN